MIWYILTAVALVYLVIGVFVARARARAGEHGMSLGIFVFTALLWPTLWL